MPQPFTHLLRVRYAECDAQNVVFNAKYGEYVDVAATEFTRAVWGDYNEVLASGFDNQVVNLTTDWQSPARFDEVLAIQVAVDRIGTTSYTLALSFSEHASGRQIARSSITYVMIAADGGAKIAIPGDLRAKLESGAEGVVSNHAGIELTD